MKRPSLPRVVREPLRLLGLTWTAWNHHNAPRIGAALAYYTTFSMAPILVIAIAVAGMVFGADAAQEEVSVQMRGLFGDTGARAVEEMLAHAHRRGVGVLATIVGTVTLLLGASSLFGELQSALNLIWGAPPPGKVRLLTLLRSRFLSFAMVLVIGFLLLVSLVVSAALSGLQGSLGGFIASPFTAQTVNLVLSVLVTTTLFALLFKVLPDVKIAWKDVGVGAFVTAVLFAIGKQLIGLYLGNSTLASAYGAAGSFVVMLVWIYYSAQLILFGAEFTQVYAHRHGPDLSGKQPTRENDMGISNGSAHWNGRLKTGEGAMKPAHGPEARFSLATRFDGQPGSNPEELIGAALSGCFSMALTGALEKAGLAPTRVETTAAVKLEKLDAGFTITTIALTTVATVAGVDAAKFQTIAMETKKTCPVSRALAGVTITLDASLAPSVG